MVWGGSGDWWIFGGGVVSGVGGSGDWWIFGGGVVNTCFGTFTIHVQHSHGLVKRV